MAKILGMLHAAEDAVLLEERLLAALANQTGRDKYATVQLMRKREDDIFYRPDSPHPRPDLVLEMIAAPGKTLQTLYPLLEQLLFDLPVAAGSLILAMVEHKFISSPPQKFYYHYLMVRRDDYSDADYLEYYSRFHSRMGFHTPAVAGYSQNYVDASASRSLASRLGLMWRPVTSVSELKMASVDAFLGSDAVATVAGPAAEDEVRFLDRHNSVSFSSEVIWRCGDFNTIDDPIFPQHFPVPNTIDHR